MSPIRIIGRSSGRSSSAARSASPSAPSCGGRPSGSLSAPLADASAERRRRLFLAAALAFGLGLIGLLVWLSDTPTLVRTAAAIKPAAFGLPVVLTILSYAAMSRSYQGIADAAGCELRFLEWLRITFVSNTVNYLVTTAGLSGCAVRMFLLSSRDIPSG